MLHDLNGFWPVRPGSPSLLYAALRGPLRLSRLNGFLTREIAICCLTEGFEPWSWGILMDWGRPDRVAPVLARILDAYRDHDEVQELAKVNALSVVREDGLDWLRTVLKFNEYYSGPVPIWTRRALRDLRAELNTGTDGVAQWLRTRPAQVAKWVADVR